MRRNTVKTPSKHRVLDTYSAAEPESPRQFPAACAIMTSVSSSRMSTQGFDLRRAFLPSQSLPEVVKRF